MQEKAQEKECGKFLPWKKSAAFGFFLFSLYGFSEKAAGHVPDIACCRFKEALIKSRAQMNEMIFSEDKAKKCRHIDIFQTFLQGSADSVPCADGRADFSEDKAKKCRHIDIFQTFFRSITENQPLGCVRELKSELPSGITENQPFQMCA